MKLANSIVVKIARMHRRFIWGAVALSRPCRTRVITVSNLPCHVIIFQKLLVFSYRTRTRTYTYTRVRAS